MRKCNDAGIALIKSFESLEDGDKSTPNIDPYLDPVGIATIGWGHAIVDPNTKQFVRTLSRARQLFPGGLTVEECETLLKGDLAVAEAATTRMIKVPLTDNQFSALVSFHFNLGGNVLAGTTSLKLINSGDYEGFAARMPLYCNSGGVKLKGLLRRRNAEVALFLTP